MATKPLRAFAALTGALLLSAAPTANAEPAGPRSCARAALPEPEGAVGSAVTAMDTTGSKFLGYAGFAGGERVLLVWDGEEMTQLEQPPGGGVLTAMNAGGVGLAKGSPTETWVYEDGKFQDLPNPGSAHSINDDSVIAGRRLEPGPDSPVRLPVAWPSPSGEPTGLELPAGATEGFAEDIGADGTIVGWASAGQGATVWGPDGTPELLPAPQSVPRESTTVAKEINGSWVAGWVQPHGTGDVFAGRWNLDTGEGQLVEGLFGTPEDISEQGWVVGSSIDGTAYLVTDTTKLTLPGVDAEAVAISPDGRTVGGTAGGHATRWVCA